MAFLNNLIPLDNYHRGLITNFSVENLKQFFRQKISTFKPAQEDYGYLFEDNKDITVHYKDIIKIGEADLLKSDDLLVITAKTLAPLTNRTGKKRQFNIAKKILKQENKDAAFFIFYDAHNNFRFSFIRANFFGAKRDFTDFKRYTYFVSPEQTNKTFITQISKCDFSDLDSILNAFSVEPLTKQFYEKLQHWYFWAINNVQFPDDAEKEPNGREIAIIRLITRLIFIWFMKVRNLIPNDLFDEEKINKILKNFLPEKSTYYKAILQNLFFATLNTKQDERKFRSQIRVAKGYNPDFGDHNVFRYHDLFADSESLNTLFSKIPFLNGGLFECLDYKTKEKEDRKYIDGFTATKGQQPVIPNFLFFCEPKKVDISNFFGTSNKTYEVQGLINLLNSYNFTIDENEPDDIEVALDPELLGSVFENLLASYNPETATTARKATGSFYTPREIVNYMTNESLKQYFKTHLTDDDIPDLDDKLNSLISSNSSDNPFNKETTQKIIYLINDLRVVDPAVGSGAFPMAMLNKLVFILRKLDPENIFWQESQINGIEKSISDPVLKRKLIEQINRQFKEKNADYGRKLYLIEKCIYGVDIQQIAVEIAKLRFFISLLVDEKIDFDKPEKNYGIEALPNLDFKLMQGNTLISSFAGIDFNTFVKQTENLLFDANEPYQQLIKDFKDIKNQYQNESDKENKKQLRSKIEKSILNIFEYKINQHLPQLKSIEQKYAVLPNKQQREKAISEEKQKFAKKLGFDIEQTKKDLIAYTQGRKSKDFFLWDVYFAEVFSQKNGFDIIIGNPPYIDSETMVNTGRTDLRNHIRDNYNLTKGNWDIYIAFFEIGFNLIKENGVLSFITPDKWLAKPFGQKLREYSLKYLSILLKSGRNVFKTVGVDSIVTVFVKTEFSNSFRYFDYIDENFIEIKTIDKNIFLPPFQLDIVFSNNIELILKITEKYTTTLESFNAVCENACATSDAYKLKEILFDLGDNKFNSEHHFKVINTGTIDKFTTRWGIKDMTYLGDKYLYPIVNKSDFFNLFKNTYSIKSKKQKLIIKGLTLLDASIDKEGTYIPGKTTLIITNDDIYLLCFLSIIINSKFALFYIKERYSASSYNTGINFTKDMINNLPIPKISKDQQKPFEQLADTIISKKQSGEDTTVQEQQIDLMVYKLYELTYEEVKIIEPEFEMSREEYEKVLNYDFNMIK